MAGIFVLVVLAGIAAAQTTNQARYRPVMDNESVAVLELDLPPHFHAPSYQNEHDVVWIGLNDATVTFLDGDRRETEVQFRPGDVRFFRSFSTQSIVNKDGASFHGVLVELKSRGPFSGACACDSNVEKAVCGCGDAPPLPRLWAVALRNVTIAGTTLGAGEAFRRPVERGNTVLVAITPLQLQDEQPRGPGAPAANAIQLQPGQAIWMNAGTHRLRNVGKSDARFVTVEF